MTALPPIAVTGMGVVTAAGAGVDALWDAVVSACPLARTVTRYDTVGLATRNAALVPDDVWTRLRERWPGQDRAVQLALAAVDEATGGRPLPPTTGLYLGTSLGGVPDWEAWHHAHARGETLPPTPRGAGHGDTALALAHALGLRGPVVTVSTACTSSAGALIQAADAVRTGELDSALVVGVDVLCSFVHVGFSRLGALTPDALPPAPFASDRAGMWLGEASAALRIEREGDAVLRYLGGGVAADGVHMTAPDREGRGIARAAERALAEAGVAARDLAWISAHATSTRFNDAMEAHGLRRLYGEHGLPPVHAAKPVTGHTLGASGLVEVVLCAEVLRHGLRPPTFQPGAMDPALPWVPLDREVNPLEGALVASCNAALAGHNTFLVLGSP